MNGTRPFRSVRGSNVNRGASVPSPAMAAVIRHVLDGNTDTPQMTSAPTSNFSRRLLFNSSSKNRKNPKKVDTAEKYSSTIQGADPKIGKRIRIRGIPTVLSGIMRAEKRKKLKTTSNNIIPRQTFLPLCKEITRNIQDDSKFTVNGLKQLHTGSELFLTKIFEKSKMCAVHAKRKTVTTNDLQLVLKITGFK